MQVFARLANYGPAAVKANLTLSVEGQVGNVTAVEIPAAAPDQVAADGTVKFGDAGSREMPFELSVSGAALVSVAIDHEDQLAADNTAWLYLPPPQLLRVLLVTTGNAFLERAIQSSGVRAGAHDGQAIRGPGSGAVAPAIPAGGTDPGEGAAPEATKGLI